MYNPTSEQEIFVFMFFFFPLWKHNIKHTAGLKAPRKFPRCNVKRALYSEGRERLEKEVGSYMLEGSKVCKEGNLHMRLVSDDSKTSGFLHQPSKS